jgi:hypothetical protein
MENNQMGSLRHEYKALILVANGLLAIVQNHQACNILTMARMAQQARDAARKLASFIERLIYERKKTVEQQLPKNVIKFEDLKKNKPIEEDEEYKIGIFEKVILLFMLAYVKIFIVQTYALEEYSVQKMRREINKIDRVIRLSKIGYIYYRAA